MALALAERGRASAGSVRVLARGVRVLFPFAVLLLLWQASAIAVRLPPYFYPTPGLVWQAFVELIRRGILPAYIADSLGRYGISVAAGVLLALLVGLVFALSRRLAETFMPFVNFFHAIVEIAWIPLFVMWFGYGFTTIALSIGYVAFFPVLYNTMLGVRRVPLVTIQAVRTLGANRLQMVCHVLLPGALPNIVTGVRLGASFGLRALIAAEMIAGHSGLGFMIFEARENHLTQRTVMGMVVIGLLWLAIDGFYLRPLERATVERWGLVERAE